jgi:hypothetical protein
MNQFILTCSMGKRLIGKAMAVHPAIKQVLHKGTLVIIAGTTNGYVAEEILHTLGAGEGFSRKGFRRGLVVPPSFDVGSVAADLAGDVVIVDGQWQQGKTIFDVVDDLHAGDVILKGANVLDLLSGQAGVYVGHPQAGTIGAALQAVAGRRVQLIVPVGLEKRGTVDVHDLAARLSAPGCEGPRMLPLPGETFTELDALELLSGASAELVAAGGIYGAEGCVWVGVDGEAAEIELAQRVIESVAGEPPCQA